jgi:anthranilate phosphoribosyltransferase
MKAAIAAALSGQELSRVTIEGAFDAMFRGEATPAQMGAFLIALRMRGETAAEIAAAAATMRKHCVRVEVPALPALLDTCGTGGDGSNTFNISTAAAIVIAACGVPVAKHGNRSASSKSGSADVLETLGVRIELPAPEIARCISELGIGFMFARAHHPAMRHVGPVRSELGVRTIFNLLGPLSNPAAANHQIIGVPERALVGVLARALRELGTERAFTVHGHGGYDELSLTGPTWVAELKGGEVREFELKPEDFGLATRALGNELQVADARESAERIRAVLRGERGAARDVVVLNAAAGLYIAGRAATYTAAAHLAAEAIDSGAAAKKLEAWITATQAR